jgi:hypothetical protein
LITVTHISLKTYRSEVKVSRKRNSDEEGGEDGASGNIELMFLLLVPSHFVLLFIPYAYYITCVYVGLCRKIMYKHLYICICVCTDRLCGLVVRVLGYRSGGPGSIPGITRKK